MSRKSVRRFCADPLHQQHGCCFYCELAIWLVSPHAFAAEQGLTLPQVAQRQCTAEHLKPRAYGGGDERENIAAACLACNMTRARRKKPPSPERWRAIRRRWVSRQVRH